MSGGESYPQLSVAFSNAKYRSPPRNRSTQLDELTDDIFMPLVDGDEFQEQEGEGINTFSQYPVFFPFLGRSLKYKLLCRLSHFDFILVLIRVLKLSNIIANRFVNMYLYFIVQSSAVLETSAFRKQPLRVPF